MTKDADPTKQGRIDLQQLSKIEMAEAAPEEVQVMFDVAKATISYGWFYYPLYSVGTDRLEMTVELAVTLGFETLAQRERSTYRSAIAWLCENGHINESLCEELQTSRLSRNDALHPRFQSIRMFGGAVRHAHYVAGLLDRYYAFQYSPRASAGATKGHHHRSPLEAGQ